MKFAVLAISILSIISAFKSSNVECNRGIYIGAFNLKVFGSSKIEEFLVKEYLVKIILRYDIILIQEIREKSGNALSTLMTEINSRTSKSTAYKVITSPRLGRTNSKEQYAFIYRGDLVTVEDFYTYEDPYDVFEREPFVIRVKSNSSAMSQFAIAGIHTSPRDAQNEISNLTIVHNDILNRWNLSNVIIMGDFNAGCSYVSKWSEVELARKRNFFWLIVNNQDTTSTDTTECAYDRIVVTGDQMLEAINPENVHVFRYDEEYNLALNTTLAISDHYPVGFQLRSEQEQKNIRFRKSFIICDDEIKSGLKNKTSKILKVPFNFRRYDVIDKFQRSGSYLERIMRKESSAFNSTISYIKELPTLFPSLVSTQQTTSAEEFVTKMNKRVFLPDGYGKYSTLKDYYKTRSTKYTVDVQCDLNVQIEPNCCLRIEAIIQ